MLGLSVRGIRFTGGVERLPEGRFARFEDPFGHPFFLFEASQELVDSTPAGISTAIG
jgi:hypothetical protein